MSVLRSRGPLQARVADPGREGVDLWAASYPGVWEMLSAPLDANGKPRQGATLMFFVQDGMVKACLNDRDEQHTAWSAALSVGELLEVLEKGLQADSLEWRRNKGQIRGKQKNSG
jgi:hypothetical protein